MEILLKEKQQEIFKQLAEQKSYLQNEINKIITRENELAISILESHDVQLVEGIRLENGRFIIPYDPIKASSPAEYQEAEVVE